MLTNGLGEMLTREAPRFQRVVDLFCGAAAIAKYVAMNCNVPVLAVDLQSYATCLADAVVSRTKAINSEALAADWLSRVNRLARQSPLYREACALDRANLTIATLVREARALCSERSLIGPMWNAYGGYYFSPRQALLFDYMRKYLPVREPQRAVCLATIIAAASRAASSPGHTAQPFSATVTAGPFIEQSWRRDIVGMVRMMLHDLSGEYARRKGTVRIADAVNVAGDLSEEDLVVVDPPYSAVQYSRFYHVLETLALGTPVAVTGRGRYPPIAQRPQSDFSKKTTSHAAFEQLLQSLGEARASVVVTFPVGKCSNAVSGEDVVSIAKRWFRVDEQEVTGRFSTLGGNNTVREGRQPSLELLLLLRPLRRRRSAATAAS